ncbi:hypothetical protein BBEV_2479 [Salisediminibacterium beveridgei]|uniref:Uncharacterized protein n=2 Tax=Salisediminibacterium beveridgei TaxID=632773 RepID=A0A1D7QXT8_9BACI|nr:hypothetical protein BBEV_2479 [Salisediminibacterium beveridgei]
MASQMAEVQNIKALRPKRKILEVAKKTLKLSISDEGLVEEIQMTVETGEKSRIDEGYQFHGHILDVVLDAECRVVLEIRKPSESIDIEELIRDDEYGQVIDLNEAFPDQFRYKNEQSEVADIPDDAMGYEKLFADMHDRLRQVDVWRKQLPREESRMDKEVSRYYHEIEQENFNAARGYKLAKELQKTLRMRRVIKVQRTELESVSNELQTVLEQFETIEKRLGKSGAFGKEMVRDWKDLLKD